MPTNCPGLNAADTGSPLAPWWAIASSSPLTTTMQSASRDLLEIAHHPAPSQLRFRSAANP